MAAESREVQKMPASWVGILLAVPPVMEAAVKVRSKEGTMSKKELDTR